MKFYRILRGTKQPAKRFRGAVGAATMMLAAMLEPTTPNDQEQKAAREELKKFEAQTKFSTGHQALINMESALKKALLHGAVDDKTLYNFAARCCD